MIISYKAWNFHVEYPSWEHTFDIKESDSSMFNPMFYKKVQGQKQKPGGEQLLSQSYLVQKA